MAIRAVGLIGRLVLWICLRQDRQPDGLCPYTCGSGYGLANLAFGSLGNNQWFFAAGHYNRSVAVASIRDTARSESPTLSSGAEGWAFWLWPNLLSLDAPLIAVLWQLLLLHSLAIQVNEGEPIVLALAVWSVYLADRAFDALQPAAGEWEPARRTFYRGHLPIASAVACGLFATTVPLGYCLLKPSTFKAGLVLTIPLAAYLLLVHYLPPEWRARWPRELAIACIFTLGTFLAAWSSNAKDISRLWGPAILFAVLCWVNCAAIETWEWQAGRNRCEEPSSSARWATQYLTTIALASACLATIMGFWKVASSEFAAAVLLSCLAMALMNQLRHRMQMNALRVAADVALCTPLLIFPFTHWL